jgi:Ca-activated chloride channel family protein
MTILILFSVYVFYLVLYAWFLRKLKSAKLIHACANTAFWVLFFVLIGQKIFLKGFSDIVEFKHPWALLFLFIPAGVVAAWNIYHEQLARQMAFSVAQLQITQKSLRATLTRFLPSFFYIAALGLMALALTRPLHIDRTVLPPTEGIDIMMVMDMSGSMDNRDFYPSRFIAAQSVAAKFVDKRPNDRIGMVVFGSYAMLQVPLTLDHEALQEHIQGMYLGMVDSNSTAIGDALGVAANHLKDSKAKSKVIILLTDGKSNAGTIVPLLAAKAAASYKIRVYTIATASTPGQTLYSSDKDEIDEGLLMEIAKATGGKFYRAKNEAELEQIYNTINELEKTAFAPNSMINRTDIYQPFLLLALAFALCAFILERLVLIKVP